MIVVIFVKARLADGFNDYHHIHLFHNFLRHGAYHVHHYRAVQVR